MGLNYHLNPSKNGTQVLIAGLLGENNEILDVGCCEGFLKDLSPNNLYFGIEKNYEFSKKALKKGYEKVFVHDLNDFEKVKIQKKFDILVFADILEHLVFPKKVLEYFVNNNLKEKGRIIISFPNIANFQIRFKLLFGNFDYSHDDILDKTHLHFFTYKSCLDFINKSGLSIIQERVSSNNFGKLIKTFPFLKNILGFGFIYYCNL